MAIYKMNPNEYVACSYLLSFRFCLALLIVIAKHQTDDGNNKIKVTIQLNDYGQMIRYSEHMKIGDYHNLFTVFFKLKCFYTSFFFGFRWFKWSKHQLRSKKMMHTGDCLFIYFFPLSICTKMESN